jgi:3-keto-L-gulonate-6-phosphate decarboxylase
MSVEDASTVDLTRREKRAAAANSVLAAAQTATVLTGPFDEALAQAQKLNKLILIDFYSSG